jgi:hypothetical protein
MANCSSWHRNRKDQENLQPRYSDTARCYYLGFRILFTVQDLASSERHSLRRSDKKTHHRDGIVHDAYSIDDTSHVLIRDARPPVPICTAIDSHVKGDQDEYPRCERPVMLASDGHASGVMKRMLKAPCR